MLNILIVSSAVRLWRQIRYKFKRIFCDWFHDWNVEKCFHASAGIELIGC